MAVNLTHSIAKIIPKLGLYCQHIRIVVLAASAVVALVPGDSNPTDFQDVGEDRFHLLYGKDHVIFAELPYEVDDWIVFEAVRRKSLRGNLKGSRKKRKNSSDFKEVAKVLVEEGMEVEKGQPMLVLNLPVPLGSIMSQHVKANMKSI
ncbi:hypothetical protein Tco_0600893, partial [Tanacetum coccineum]